MRHLPEAHPAFHWVDGASGPVLRCGPLEAIAQHGFTSRQPEFPKLVDSASQRLEPWQVAARSVGTADQQVMRVRQVHGSVVRYIARGQVTPDEATQRPDGDAIVSNEPGIALAVSVADCVPVLVADPISGTAAAIHAGWRGMSAGVIGAAVRIMQRECGAVPADCLAAIGPSIGPDDYTVGPALVDAFRAAGHDPRDVDRWFRRTADRLTLDLWSAGRDQLAAAGVPSDRVFACGLSTLSHPDIFESFRADGEKAGRMSALIVVPKPGVRTVVGRQS